ncbi:ABC transporter ATP-binding protein [Alicyclobacillus fastidiosus]|uniref:ABC transporter ATP-binding protein n=1 Tax=Alicyclobacillus fastidiosus TaxID=392011 RepID=A0ABV5AFB0_9BACL|nr:ABC transporter ATP-binding protein [Alicyclobacillus fastidiosus]WEH09694.1 ABC transporter ATP-binding protein [Alicyclobacillus fastidiosus]
MAKDVAVEIRNLTKVIGGKTIVDNLSFDIPRGEVFGFLGPNGAGKTTTIRMMVGLISKTKGEVFINGIDVSKHFKEAMKHVGAIVENPEMYKFLTGYQNLRHFANMCPGVTEARIQEVVKLVGLDQRIHDRVRTYSLGMRQRLGLAQALLRDPDVLILDEPTNGLDPAGIRELRDQLRWLAQNKGVAVIVSSHLLSEMELMCDRVAIIQAGKLIDVKTVREMVEGETDTSVIEFEVGDVEQAKAVLSAQYPALTADLSEKGLRVSVDRDKVPDVVASLVKADIKIYGVNAVSKSLEESFLEITGGSGIV